MSILTDVLQEELERLERQKSAYLKAMQELPKGYISQKNIRGRATYYLQYREGDKIISKYIPKEQLPELEAQIKRRKQLELSLRRVEEDKKKLRKVLE